MFTISSVLVLPKGDSLPRLALRLAVVRKWHSLGLHDGSPRGGRVRLFTDWLGRRGANCVLGSVLGEAGSVLG